MVIRKLVIGAVFILALGTTGIAFAKGNSNQRQFNRTSDYSMHSIITQYASEELGQDIKDYDFTAMTEFMNNLSDEDYQRMIDYMREYGYGNRAAMLERMDKDDMIAMHNARGGADCLGNGNRSFSNARCQRRIK